ncbi:MAG: DUF305 domain-containing protein [Gemmatimonadota bacterium]
MIVNVGRRRGLVWAFLVAATALASPRPVEAQDPASSAARLRSDSAAVAKARADSARYPYTSADIEFMSGMIGHHAQAVAMSRWAASHGASGPIQRLADRIINAQVDEIALMSRWLRDRNQPVPEANPKGMKMIMNGMEHMMLMPGMLTEEQMTDLDKARGPEFDKKFLVYMMQHHDGAVGMVKQLFGTVGAGQDEMVFKFASDVQIDQTTEITRMQQLRIALEFGTLPP